MLSQCSTADRPAVIATDKKFRMGDYVGNDSPMPKLKIDISRIRRGGVCVKYHPRVVFSFPILSYPLL